MNCIGSCDYDEVLKKERERERKWEPGKRDELEEP